MWIALLVCLYWLPWTWPHCFHLSDFEQAFACWVSTAGVVLKVKEVQSSHNSHDLQRVITWMTTLLKK